MRTQRKCTRIARTVVATVASAALALALVPATALAAPATTARPAPTAEQIQALLDGRDYAPGEAIVVAEKGANLNVGQPEQLAEASEDALEQTATAADASAEPTHNVAAERAEQSNAASYEISVVRSDTKSTAELIEELYGNPKVISAEPNYVKRIAAEETEGDSEQAASTSSRKDAAATPLKSNDADSSQTSYHELVGDLTSQQWGMSNDGTLNTPEQNAVGGVDMNVPNWDEHRTDSSYLNSDPESTVAVLDSGMDVNHPDLKNVFYTFSEELQRKYGCGLHGYNASVPFGDPKAGDLTDTIEHGTHVCGIVAAEWNNEGISGVANGAKLIGVRLESDEGGQTTESNIRAFQFVINIARDVNLKAINCSWGADIGIVEFTHTLLVNQLGAQGVVTVFASSNEGVDIDENVNTQSTIDSPYVINVDAMGPGGERVGFSNYGQAVTDVFTPGARIMSTVPDYIRPGVLESEGGIHRYFYPQASGNSEHIAAHCTFSDGSDNGVAAYSSNPVEDTSASKIGGLVDKGSSDAYAYGIPVDGFVQDEVEAVEGAAHMPSHLANLAIPVDTSGLTVTQTSAGKSTKDISYVSAQVALDGKLHQMDTGFFGFVATTKDGGTKIVDYSKDTSGLYNSSTLSAGPFGWVNPTLHVKHLLDADPDATGVYLDDNNRMIVQLNAFNGAPIKDYDHVFFDDIAVGTTGAKAGAYINFNGTSMAAPAAVGALAVIAKDEKKAYNFTDEEVADGKLSLQALKRSARLRAAVNPREELDQYCASGGHVDLSWYGSPLNTGTENAPFAPTITKATAGLNGTTRTLNIEGYFFDSWNRHSRVFIDDTDITTSVVTSENWVDNDCMTPGKITAKIPDSVKNGAHIVCVQTSYGKDKFALSTSYESTSDSDLNLYEETLPVPDVSAEETFSTEGTGKMCGGLVGSGDYIYALQDSASREMLCMWRYQISTKEWSVCAKGKRPEYAGKEISGASTSGTLIAPTDEGVVLYTKFSDTSQAGDEEGGDETIIALFDYDATHDSWSVHETQAELPDNASIFTKGNDIYFVGGFLDSVENSLYLSVLKPGAKKVKVLGSGTYAYSSYLSAPRIAVTNEYVYATGEEPIGGTYKMPSGLVRLSINEEGNVAFLEDCTDVLETVVKRNVFMDRGAVKMPDYVNRPALAGLPGGIVTVGSSYEGTDSYKLEDANPNPKLEPLNITSSYYQPNSQMAGYYKGKIYAMGHSPSEPGKMYFRATPYTIDLNKEHAEAWSGPTDEEAASQVSDLISSLPDADELTSDDLASTDEAQNAYDTLSAAARELVASADVAKLQAATKAAEQIKNAADSAVELVKLAKDLCKEAGIAYDDAKTPAENIAAAQKAIKAAMTSSNTASQESMVKDVCKAVGVAYDKSKTPAKNLAAANAAAKAAKSKLNKIAKSVKTITINKKTVTAKALAKEITTVGGSAKYVKTVILGSKVKKIKASAFKKLKKVKTLQVQTKKLTKKSVKKSLKGSKVKTVVVNLTSAKAHKKYVKKYKKIFTKKNAGKKASVK